MTRRIQKMGLFYWKLHSDLRFFSVLKYRVWVFPGQTLIGVSETTANIYIRLVGEKGETGTISITNKTTLEVEFSTQNLGRLVTLTIGHDNSGWGPSWVSPEKNIDEKFRANKHSNYIVILHWFFKWTSKNVPKDWN